MSDTLPAGLFDDRYRNKTVLVTGHTGFKGSWLAEWLYLLGARVAGYSLEPPTTPSHFAEIGLGQRMAVDFRGDVRSLADLTAAVIDLAPDFLFHLAAQPLVRLGYESPYETFETNFLGTLNVLEAVRANRKPCVVVLITTDKVYENREWLHAYRENDPLGGHDPYSASKASAEIMIASYNRSFFRAQRGAAAQDIVVASARAGNVIGGGDWAIDRIVPDCMRSLANGQKILVRNKHATRPWQHVLEPLAGYLRLGAELAKARENRNEKRLNDLCSAFNFGPFAYSNRSVEALVEEVLKHWPGRWQDHSQPHAPHEAGKLNLAIDRAFHLLGWQPRWSFEETIERTVRWYKLSHETGAGQSGRLHRQTKQDIAAYCQNANL